MKDLVGISIKDILSREYGGKYSMIVGDDQVDIAVNNVMMLTNPSQINNIKSGSLVLTSSYIVEAFSLDERKMLMDNCHNVVIAIQGDEKLLKDSLLIKMAKDKQITIFVLSEDNNLTDIILYLNNALCDKRGSMNSVEDIYKRNMKIIASGGGIEQVLKNIGNILNNQVFLRDYHFNKCRYVQVDNIHRATKLFDDMLRDVNTIEIDEIFTQQLDMKSPKRTKVSLKGEDVDRIMVPVMINNHIYGHLIMYGISCDISEADVMSLEMSAHLISMEMLKRISLFQFENKQKSNFFLDLISPNEMHRKGAIKSAFEYEFDIYARYSVLIIDYISDDSELMAKDVHNTLMAQTAYMVNVICQAIHKNSIVIKKDKGIQILFMWQRSDDYKSTIYSIIDSIQSMIYHKMHQLSYHIGIGRVYDGLDKVINSYTDAMYALDATEHYCEDDVVDFDNLGIYKLLCQQDLKDEFISFYNETLKPLVVYDRRRDTELVKSLMYYFEMNGNLKKMSEKLFTHYNTVLYRVNRIQEITGKNLDDEEDRYGLQTALKIMKVLNL